MKVMVEYADIDEVEVTVRGSSSDNNVLKVMAGLQSLDTSMNEAKQILGSLDDATYILDPQEILFFEVEQDIVYAITDSKRYKMKQRLYEVEQLVLNREFIRISKWCLANIQKIEKIESGFNATMTLFFKNSKLKQTLTRSYLKGFKEKVLG